MNLHNFKKLLINISKDRNIEINNLLTSSSLFLNNDNIYVYDYNISCQNAKIYEYTYDTCDLYEKLHEIKSDYNNTNICQSLSNINNIYAYQIDNKYIIKNNTIICDNKIIYACNNFIINDNIDDIMPESFFEVTCGNLSNYVFNKLNDYQFYAAFFISSMCFSDLTCIGKKVFRESTLTDIKFLKSNTFKSIQKNSFDCCDLLRNVIIENNIEKIEEEAFYDCIKLSSIELPDSLETIGDKAFKNCISLSSISLPRNIVNISNSAFVGCSNLREIVINNENELINLEHLIINYDVKIFVPSKIFESYINFPYENINFKYYFYKK